MLRMNKFILVVATVFSVSFLLIQPVSGQGADTVAGKTYTVWASQSFGAPPFPPFQDCAVFTLTTMDLLGCPGPGALSEFPLFGALTSLFLVQNACAGFLPALIGTSLDGGVFGAADVMGGILLNANAPPDTFGIEGVRDSGCFLGAQESNPYNAP